ncbi:MAG TPA: class I adenylate-forming enzyme family protein [Polyangiaceae bacterium]|nr:class I adenylate-forming enzyme family protein [Polyangiaceae bacterium]
MPGFANADYCGFADLLWQGRSSSYPVANVAGDEKTWEDFVRACAGWRALFQARPEQRFGLFHADTWQFAAALFGAWNAGKVPILPGDTQPATVAALAAEVEAFAGQLPATLGKPTLAEAVPSGDLGRVSAFDPASVTLGVMTSGSTGTPVSFPKQLGQLEREVATLESVFGERLGKVRVLGTVSHQHIYGLLFRVLWPLSAGRTFESEQLFFAEEIVAHAERAPGVVLVSSPAHLRRLPESLPVAKRLFRAVFSSGGPLDFTGALACRDRFGCLPFEIFGSSETGGIAYRERTEDAAPWTTLPGVEVAVDVESCLLRVRSPHLADDEWLTTSDRVALLGSGNFELLGRSDRIVKIGEKRISLRAVESALTESELVAEARVVLVQSERDELCAVVVPSAAGHALLEREGKIGLNRALKAAAAPRVEPIGLPRRFRYLERLPENSQGKVLEGELRALFTGK